MSTQHEINAHLMDWDALTRQFKQELIASAAAEADHKRDRARYIVKARADNPKLSAAQAEAEAEADDAISERHLERLGTAALAEATKQRLIMMRAKSDALRSARVDERESNALYRDHPGSP